MWLTRLTLSQCPDLPVLKVIAMAASFVSLTALFPLFSSLKYDVSVSLGSWRGGEGIACSTRACTPSSTCLRLCSQSARPGAAGGVAHTNTPKQIRTPSTLKLQLEHSLTPPNTQTSGGDNARLSDLTRWRGCACPGAAGGVAYTKTPTHHNKQAHHPHKRPQLEHFLTPPNTDPWWG